MAEPLTLAELKAQCRVTSTHEDALITSYGVAAREWVEDYTGHILAQRVVTDTFREWGDFLTLRHQPISVGDPTPTLAVSYEDAEGDETEYEDRVIRDQAYPWTIYPPYGAPFPTLADNGSIVVSYTAGYASASAVPIKFKQAIRVLVAAMHANRGEIPQAAADTSRWLLRSYRGAVMA